MFNKKLYILYILYFSSLSVFAEDLQFDVRNTDFSKEIVSLKGNWEFYWHEILAPGDVFPSELTDYPVPKEWDKNTGYSPKGYGTYRISVLLPETEFQLAMFVPFTMNHYKISINNRVWAENGIVSPNSSINQNRQGQLLRILPEVKKLDIIYQISNFDDMNGGILEAPQIGSFDNLKAERNKKMIFEAFLFGTLFITGMLYLSFYINKKDDNSSLYFGLFSITLALRTLLYGEHILLLIFNNLSVALEATMGHMTFYLALPLFLMFICREYPCKFSKIVRYPVFLISGVYVLFSIFLPHRIYVEFLFIYQIVTFITCLLIILWLISRAYNKNMSAMVTLGGFIVLLGTAINDILYSQDLIHTFHMVPIGMTGFIISQATLLSWNIGRAFTQSEELSQELRSANTSFKRFVPVEFLKFLKKERVSDIQLGDHVEMDMTVLFCDIRDFTSLSENMNPRENFLFLNSFLERIGPVIRENDGFVDKYLGDGIMALFPGNADSAVQAALKIQVALKLYNKHRKNSGYDPIRIGIGINTGDLMMGTIGENERMDSTVISDAVNVCSRIESITKEYGLNIAISEKTYSRLTIKDDLEIRNIGKVFLKGKMKPVTVYELYNGDEKELIEKKNQQKNSFEIAVKMFENRDYVNALTKFTEIVRIIPNDEASYLYQAKIQLILG
ncbi:MAG: adenylate/guanylate cyclase domain-containing protein [Spirochaetaceae bacterium]|jgi:adenylate cyclase|nr:adenylate/guanylate cyclase domain-containing protein [Spirochaetaceae bacterium]